MDVETMIVLYFAPLMLICVGAILWEQRKKILAFRPWKIDIGSHLYEQAGTIVVVTVIVLSVLLWPVKLCLVVLQELETKQPKKDTPKRS